MRFLIRSVDFKDLEGLLALAQYFPLCSLPPQRSLLEKKIQISKESFQHILSKENRNYIFILEDLQEKKIIGSSQILSYFGSQRSLCYFLKKQEAPDHLKLEWIQSGRHQIGGVILHPDYRKSKNQFGLQIGAVRFLYIKTFPQEFSSIIEVSLTAPIKGTTNHFWEETGEKYLKMDYPSALKIFQNNRTEFFKLFPKNLKINLHQLSPTAKNYMEQVHSETYPVYKGLIKMGFHSTNRYHVMDGGIYLEAYWEKLAFLKRAKKHFLKKGKMKKEFSQNSSFFLLSQNTEKGFVCAPMQGRAQDPDFLAVDIPPKFQGGKPTLALPFPN